MEQKTVILGAALLLIGIGIGYALGGNMPARQGLGAGGMGDGSMMSQNIDQHFIVQMIPHHEGAIEMAKIALERSKRPEVISLANDIIEAQQKEIDDMREWYREWFGASVPEGGVSARQSLGVGGGMMHMGGMEGDVRVLASVSESDFDREFIEQMIPHHEMAIMMAQMLQASTNRDEMKVLADNIITSQAREIDMMRDWLTSWY